MPTATTTAAINLKRTAGLIDMASEFLDREEQQQEDDSETATIQWARQCEEEGRCQEDQDAGGRGRTRKEEGQGQEDQDAGGRGRTEEEDEGDESGKCREVENRTRPVADLVFLVVLVVLVVLEQGQGGRKARVGGPKEEEEKGQGQEEVHLTLCGQCEEEDDILSRSPLLPLRNALGVFLKPLGVHGGLSNRGGRPAFAL